MWKLRLIVGVLALAGALLHVALTPRHHLMQMAAAQSSSVSKTVIGFDGTPVPICHAQGSDSSPSGDKPAKPVGPCLLCSGLQAAATLHLVTATLAHCPVERKGQFDLADLSIVGQERTAAFSARAPPARA